MTIDFHTHPIPEKFKEGLRELGIDPIKDDGFPLPICNIEEHIEFMKKANIDYSILSLPSPHIFEELSNREAIVIIHPN